MATMDSKSTVPTTMKAVHLVKYLGRGASDLKSIQSSFKVYEIATPVPAAGQILVKVECSPINPSDMATLSGRYNSAQKAPLPCTLGYEGSGIVVSAGEGKYGASLVGKRVAISTRGGGMLWSQYVVSEAMGALPLGEDVTAEQGCACFVNPLTVVSFLEIAAAGGHKSVVHGPANSALGKMLIRLGKTMNIGVIGIVRSQKAKKEMEEMGVIGCVATSDEKWASQLRKLCADNNCRLAFDAVAGTQCGTVMSVMPAGSHVHNYGAMSGKPIGGISPTDIIFADKELHGFWLTKYMKSKDAAGSLKMMKTVSANITGALSTSVRKVYPLDQLPEALVDYQSDMSSGKICLGPALEIKNSEAYPKKE